MVLPHYETGSPERWARLMSNLGPGSIWSDWISMRTSINTLEFELLGLTEGKSIVVQVRQSRE